MRIKGQVYQGGTVAPAVIEIGANGKILAIDSPESKFDMDFGTDWILPAGIDIHVHFREPGLTHKENFDSGTLSALHGGVVAVIDMPNTVPATLDAKRAREKLTLAAAGSRIDYGIWAGATARSENLEDLLHECLGLKIYLGATTGDLLVEESSVVAQALKQCARDNKPVIVHCEAQRVLTEHAMEETLLCHHDESRPPEAEVEAIRDLLAAKEGAGDLKIHVAHIASSAAVDAAMAANFSCGVCPHHIFLDTEMNLGTKGKMNPPLRTNSARNALWDRYQNGDIEIVESDHAPHTLEEKSKSFKGAPSGIPGVETMVPLILAKVVAGKLSLQQAVESYSRNPANLVGLTSRCRIEVGCMADLIVVKPVATKINERFLHSKAGWTPFHGHDALFPTHVWNRGNLVLKAGIAVAKPGDGARLTV